MRSADTEKMGAARGHCQEITPSHPQRSSDDGRGSSLSWLLPRLRAQWKRLNLIDDDDDGDDRASAPCLDRRPRRMEAGRRGALHVALVYYMEYTTWKSY